MDIHGMLHLLQEQVAETDWLQWTAILFGVAEVLLARVNNILLYPAGIISTVLTIYILAVAGLYAESALNGYYFVMSIYGWWHWHKRKHEPPLPIAWTSAREWMITAGIVVFGFAVLYGSLKQFTPSTVPGWDAWVSATAWAGTWLLAKRKIENWVLLNVSNIFAIPLLFYKQLPLFAGLTVILFVVACFGYFDWIKRYKTQGV
ncbi:nicotinamide riboside transporter PnuC [Puia dinghuensis]|uniref:Nicotinamide riboside transporter PnuC n=1 Tax=Puia dinghuensis TaxID=1792502 RepID=A0A8J2U669_9BACT|nr:nicotinamide riboside transporter PnuC [Puia dinghuensis]GGA81432.1 nicotinamide mononucleotide transporter [Puia dinghuensis]